MDSPSLGSIDEKKEHFGELIPGLVNTRQFNGRPDIAETISHAVSDSAGTSLVVGKSSSILQLSRRIDFIDSLSPSMIACGPVSLANEVRQVALQYPTFSLQVEIASFEC